MENEFVVRDPSALVTAETTIRAADQLLKILGKTVEQISETQSELADAFDAIADVIQVAVMKHTGVEVRRVGSAPTDRETGEIALHSIQVNLGYDTKSRAEHELRNRQQLLATTVHAYRKQLCEGNENDATHLLDKALKTIDAIASEFGDVKRADLPQGPTKSIVLVEHDREERELMQQVLADHDFEVRAFADDESALQFVLEQPRDATMLLNVQHPDCAKHSIDRIRNHMNGSTMCVIGMSSLPLSDVKLPLDAEGVQHWFQKPFCPSALIESIHTASVGRCQAA